MKNFKYQNSRKTEILRIQSINIRFINRKQIHQILYYLLLGLTTILAFSCKKAEEPKVNENAKKEEIQKAELLLNIDDKILSSSKIKSIDILIYEKTGLKEICDHIYAEKKDLKPQYSLLCNEGEKIIVVIANNPKVIKKATILKYESCLTLEFDFTSEQDSYPIMTAILSSSPQDRETMNQIAVIENLETFNAIVRIEEIINNLDDYELLENPRFRLRNLSSTINPFNTTLDHPKDYLDAGDWKNLVYDIGMEPQYPGTTFSCYPNLSNSYLSATQLEFECVILGKTKSFMIDLPALERRKIVNVSIIIDEDFTCQYQLS